ncbi:MAG: glycosyltransferase [Deltaproteobacteria bacterium]|nr:glycosyltransferase [Deltaproteobacteria bacterium]
MKKILSILEFVASSRGGGAVHVLELARRLDLSRFKLTVAMSSDELGVTEDEITATGAEFHPLDLTKGSPIGQLFRLAALIRSRRFDLVHFHGARAAFWGRLACTLVKPRPAVVYSIHGFSYPFYPGFKQTVGYLFERLVRPITDLVVCVSDNEKEEALRSGLFPASRVAVIKNGISSERFTTPANVEGITGCRSGLGLNDDQRLLVMGCRLDRPRDLDVCVKAMARLKDAFPDTRLVIAGEGPEFLRIQNLIKLHRLEHAVSLVGFRRDMPELLAAADVFMLTSWGWEGLPLAVMEAMAAELPVVATAAGGLPELVKDGETGFLVPIGDDFKLAEKLSLLLSNADLRQRLGQAGRERVVTMFSAHRMAQEMSNRYLELTPGCASSRNPLSMSADKGKVRWNDCAGGYDLTKDDSSGCCPWEEAVCPICGRPSDSLWLVVKGFSIMRCRDCRLAFVSPRPSEAVLAKFYSGGYFTSDSEINVGYQNYGSMEPELVKTFQRRLKEIQGFIRGGRLLDVGCGYGYFLQAAQTLFSECWGLDVAPEACEQVRRRGFPVFWGRLDEASFENEQFDLVAMSDLFEHIYRPQDFLDQVKRVLKPDGLLYLTTPNMASVLAKISGRRWVSFKLPEHIVYYTPSSISKILSLAGFEVLSITRAGQYCRLDFILKRIAQLVHLEGVTSGLTKRLQKYRGMMIYADSGSMNVLARRK